MMVESVRRHQRSRGFAGGSMMLVYKFLTAEFGLKSLREKRLKLSTLDDLNDPFELLPYDMTDRKNRGIVREAAKVWGSKHGMLCMSADWRDPVIWAHYADKHKGLCLGFEVAEKTVRHVRYVDRRLPFPKSPEAIEIEEAYNWFLTKFKSWAYEKEIRSWIKLLDTLDGGLHFKSFDASLRLVRVIAGARCATSLQELENAARPLAGVEFIKARAGFSEFEIVIDERGFSNS
jgi:hypothetical protein